MRSVLGLCAMLGLAACGAPESVDNGVSTNFADNGTVVVDNGAAAVDSVEDVPAFATKAAVGDLFETESSRLALDKASSPTIRDYAQTMIAAHRVTTATLKRVVGGVVPGFVVPTTLDRDHAEMLSTLKRSQNGSEFETSYLDQQSDVHQSALTLMQDYVAKGTSPAIQRLAKAAQPMIAEHLKMAKTLDKAGEDKR